MDASSQYRMENDTLGSIMVPKSAYYGSQTQRAIDNFNISGITLPRVFIKAQGIIKAASATTNMALGTLAPDMGKAIVQAAEEVIEGKWDNEFVVDVYQAGAGTSQNMNVNEVIASRATELGGGTQRVNPNDHVNMSQSTNDTFPSALNMAATEEITARLLPALSQLQEAFQKKADQFMPILKAGRTHLHDGVPIRLGQEFSGYAETVNTVRQQLTERLDGLYVLGLGGNAVGTKGSLQPGYIPKVMEEVRKRTNMPFREPINIFSFMQNMNEPIRCMLTLKELATHLIKITSDLRLLSSGPRTGLAEITLPSVQPGSTIMPGKVNPAILEMTHMVCCQVIGYETAVATAGIAGQLEINVMMPVIAHTFLHAIDLMVNAINTLVPKCINGIDVNQANCERWMNESLSLVTGLSPSLGYDMASQIGMSADEENKTIKQILMEKGLLTDEVIQAIDPKGMA
ncbi:aspartate ammonia-lyase [Salipaludibacillus agaradhaerens]|uniref:class II fumarate hydratase n=1 Tax=Salipaludibacillus agaradhaerens TaxID=76935 RepID=UPI002150FFCD|nr:aspartate ammonia-lyase [Salipaludibacillus agaradhaerens]MCR6105025.1 aspartate ammonia-lyase [Salipaludibacillus agaradhaerens]MCR6117070.1 aspartate ammonia-lyase [Salipaludibacillus agaradhaerens]